jgi:hypothetical protein
VKSVADVHLTRRTENGIQKGSEKSEMDMRVIVAVLSPTKYVISQEVCLYSLMHPK